MTLCPPPGGIRTRPSWLPDRRDRGTPPERKCRTGGAPGIRLTLRRRRGGGITRGSGLMDLFAGLFVGGVGRLALLLGYRLFLLLLPLWGFVVGFAVGARLVSLVFDQGFL